MENHPERKGNSLKRKAVLTLGALGVGAVGAFGVDQKAKSVDAADNTPTPTATATRTPTPTPTGTPDAREQQIAALQTAVAKAEKERDQDKKIADLRATETALRETPTKTATPPKPTETPIPLSPAEALATRNAGIDAKVEATVVSAQLTATARAGGTAIAEAKTTPTRGGPGGGGGPGNEEGGGFPWGLIPVGGALAGAGVFGWFRREQIKGAARRGWARRGEARDILRRGRDWVRDRAVDLWRRRPGGPGPAPTP